MAPASPTHTLPTPAPASTASPTLEPLPTTTPDTLARMTQNPMPAADPVALAGSLRQDGEAPRLGHAAPEPATVGATRSFWVGDLEAGRMRSVNATLRVQTEHLDMWVQDDALVEAEALERSARAFEERIYPAVREYFAPDWRPGRIDGNPRLAVLNTHISGVAGYFAAANLYPREVNPYSNEREMFVMNLSALSPGTPPYDSVLAHELQHMIHWHLNPNQDAWVNEGASQLAEDVSGYGWPVAAVAHFTGDTDLQLNTWSDDRYQVAAHYGASYLIMRYYLDRYGHAAVRALVHEQASGINAFDRVLRREAGVSFHDLFADWLIANVLDDPDLDDGRYGYESINVAARVRQQIDTYPQIITDEVRQYGAHYIELRPDGMGPLRVSFTGAPMVRVVPVDAASGHWLWWSNRGDAGHSYLEREFDLTGVRRATLSYRVWHDIEAGWDFAYVRASVDGGETWTLLHSAHMTTENPTGNALGPGYTGLSGDGETPVWIRDEVDLSDLAGQVVRVRFDYVTDDAIHGAGLCLDDFALQAVEFADDVETDKEGWIAEGFIRHDNRLPQEYIVRAIEVSEGEFGVETRIHDLAVDADGRGEWRFEGFDEVRRVILVISAVAPATTEPAPYTLSLQRVAQGDGQ
jgi:hypothetical protein